MIKLLKEIIEEYSDIVQFIKGKQNADLTSLRVLLHDKYASIGICFYLVSTRSTTTAMMLKGSIVAKVMGMGRVSRYLCLPPRLCDSRDEILEVTEKRVEFLKELLTELES